jgi:hypothetical protein
MKTLTLKLRIAMLWIFTAVAAYRCVHILDPGVIEELLAGELVRYQSPGILMVFTLLWLVPLAMAFLTATLRGAANRWTNIVLGIVFTLLNIYHLIEHLGFPAVHQLLIVGSTVVATALIVWYAWKWPAQEE